MSYRVAGTTEDHEGRCEHCGTSIEHGVIIDGIDADGNKVDQLVWGRVCAAKVLRTTAANIARHAADADTDNRAEAARVARYAAALAEWDAAGHDAGALIDREAAGETVDFLGLFREHGARKGWDYTPDVFAAELAARIA